VENFNFVPLPVTEDEKAGREGVQLKPFLDQHGQPVDGLAQIGGTAGEVNPVDTKFI